MKRIYLFIIACALAMASYAQGYSKQQLEALSDSIFTNPEYVKKWADTAIKKNSKCSDAYFLKACAFVNEKDYLKALELLEKSLKTVSKQSVYSKSEILCIRGGLYYQVGDVDLALADLTEAIKISPMEYDPYEYRISLYKELKQYENAEQDCRKLLTLNDSLSYKLELVNILVYQEKTEEALSIVNNIIKYQPREILPYATRSWVYANIGNFEDAINDYLQFIALGGDYSLDHLIVLSEDNYDYTINKLSQLIIADENKDTWLGIRARLYLESQEYELSLSDINLLSELINAETPFVLYYKSLCYEGLSNYSKQVEVLTKLIELQEEPDSYALALRGVAYENLAAFDKAIEDLNSSLEIDPNNYLNYVRRGWVYEKDGDLEKALKDYNMSLILNPNVPITRIKRAEILLETGNKSKAKEDLKIALELDSISNTYAFALVLLDKENEAIDFMKSKLEKEPNNKSNLYDLACIYSLANKKKEAIETLEKAVKSGYKNYNHIKYDRDFINIREEQGFKDILANISQAKVLKMFEGLGK